MISSAQTVLPVRLLVRALLNRPCCPYAGLDDINEFEAELEAPEKWARRFRMMREAEEAPDEDGASSQGGEGLPGQTQADVKGESSSNEGSSSEGSADDTKPGSGDDVKPRPE